MKRLAIICTVILIIMCILGFCQPVMKSEDFSGLWYSAEGQRPYRFQEGLIYCGNYSVPVSGKESISGAYSYSKDEIFLFAAGIEGLETEKLIYLFRIDDGCFLCENKDGSGTIYFFRSAK